MASLKDIKERISSVNGTLKVTNAMRMVASVKFRRAHKTVETIIPYQKYLQSIFANLMEAGVECTHLTGRRPEKRIAIVAVASDSGLCGSYNGNIIRALEELVAGCDNIEVYPIGKKVRDASLRMRLNIAESDPCLSHRLTYERAATFAAHLEKRYLDEEIDRVVLLYQHLRSAASTEVVCENFLPIHSEADTKYVFGLDIIVEPDINGAVKALLPKLLSSKIYAVLCDAAASEHASRMIAMQSAGDNAQRMLSELRLQYNRLRQQAITSQLLDIVSGTMR